MYETFCENCSHFMLKWFQPNSFGEVCFLPRELKEVLRKYAKKIKFRKFWERPQFDIREYTFKHDLWPIIFCADILGDSIQSYNEEDTEQFKTIVTFECRGIEPVEFSPRVSIVNKLIGISWSGGGGGGALTLESGTGMCRGHDPLFSGQSALPSLPIYHQCAHFQFLEEKIAFSALFWPKFWLSRCKYSKFLSPRPLIF